LINSVNYRLIESRFTSLKLTFECTARFYGLALPLFMMPAYVVICNVELIGQVVTCLTVIYEGLASDHAVVSSVFITKATVI